MEYPILNTQDYDNDMMMMMMMIVVLPSTLAEDECHTWHGNYVLISPFVLP